MRLIAILAVLIAITTFIACKDDIITPQGNTPTDVLELIEESFNRQGISVLDSVLSTDFVFYFNPADVGTPVDGYIIPDSWNRDDYMRACGNMFTEAYSVEFEVDTTGVENPEDGVTNYEAYNVTVYILVMIDATNGFIADGVCDFEFINDTSGGYDDWKVSKWYDRTLQYGSAVLSGTLMEPSFGVILAMFY